MTARKVLLFTLLLSTVLATAGGGYSSESTFKEYRVKLAYIYNFIRFVRWPETDEETSIRITIIGKDQDKFFGNDLSVLSGKKIRSRDIEIEQTEDISRALETHNPPHVAFFLSNSEASEEILSKYRNSAILTIGETDEFFSGKGIITFLKKSNKLRFKINLDTASRVKIDIPAKILKSAEEVEGRRRSR